MALKLDGSLWSWGDVPIAGCDWPAVAAGQYHRLALKSDGSLWAWGDNYYGQLGIGTTDDNEIIGVPTRVGTDSDWVSVTAGGSHTLALKMDGSLWAWGRNDWGQLGIATSGPGTEVSIPTRVGTGKDWTAIAGGAFSSVALKTDGSMWNWGFWGWWPAITNVPIRVGNDNDWDRIAAGHSYQMAIKKDGTMWVWDGETNGFVPVGVGYRWKKIARTYLRSPGQCGACSDAYVDFALRSDGSLWGRIWYETTAFPPMQTEFARIGNANNWTDVSGVALGEGQFFRSEVPVITALKSDGTLWQTRIGGWPFFPYAQTSRVNDDIDWGPPDSLPLSNELRVVRQVLSSDAKFRSVVGPLSNDCYAVLYRGSTVTSITRPVDVRLAPCARAIQLTDSTPASTNAPAFYRVRQVPIFHPLDSDGDGIDDVYELRHPNFLNPLDASDASQDFDGDGKSNLQEYVDATDPEMP